MPFFVKNSREDKRYEDALQFPDRTACKTVKEYDERVTAYWKAIDRYQGLATAFHEGIMERRNRKPSRGKADPDAKAEE
jgi:hypothetical protein